ncbi:hypothetical protein ACTWQF_03065 [Streptomyces sp. 8N114]|uniref:hypothetical protein n=1 Tax=Streptomyces sp. 8N114 TaxID=3457419 RepID=UPI003FD6B577
MRNSTAGRAGGRVEGDRGEARPTLAEGFGGVRGPTNSLTNDIREGISTASSGAGDRGDLAEREQPELAHAEGAEGAARRRTGAWRHVASPAMAAGEPPAATGGSVAFSR